jgi:hypothetical protein
LGIGDLGIGDWGLGHWAPIPNPQSPMSIISYVVINAKFKY